MPVWLPDSVPRMANLTDLKYIPAEEKPQRISEIQRRLWELRKVRPDIAVELRSRQGKLFLEIFRYVSDSKSRVHLEKVDRIVAPVVVGDKLALDLLSWIDEQIRQAEAARKLS